MDQAPRILLHELLPHQQPVGDSTARFKVLRAGRRWGKTAFAEHISIVGHGPRSSEGDPQWKGLMHGFDVVWMGPTIPQTNLMWHRDVVPRFKGRPGIKLNENDKTVTIQNDDETPFAILWVRSAEAANSVRGIGAKLAGIVIDEAAWMDLERVWLDVLRPTLMDLGGWALIMGTTNSGSDGHQDEAGPRTPSYFNILCTQIQEGNRTDDYREFYGTARDNPVIKQSEFDTLVAEYPADSPVLAQEIFAKLIIGGAGVAFPEWDDTVHIARYEPPLTHGTWSGMGDWGYRKPGGLWLLWTGAERSLVRFEYYFREVDPYTVGFNFGNLLLRIAHPDYITVDTPAVADGGPTIMEELQRGMNDVWGGLQMRPPVFLKPPKGPGSRETKKSLTHDALRYERDASGIVQPWMLPKLQVHPDCRNLIRVMQKLPRDPKGKEDVDTDAEDHPYDALADWLLSRAPYSKRDFVRVRNPDDHPGYDDQWREKHAPSLREEIDRRRGPVPRWTPYRRVVNN